MCQKRLLSHIMPGETTCIQCSVNMDAFMGGATPEILWGNDGAYNALEKGSAEMIIERNTDL